MITQRQRGAARSTGGTTSNAAPRPGASRQGSPIQRRRRVAVGLLVAAVAVGAVLFRSREAPIESLVEAACAAASKPADPSDPIQRQQVMNTAFSPDLVFRLPDRNSTYRGRAEVLGHLESTRSRAQRLEFVLKRIKVDEQGSSALAVVEVGMVMQAFRRTRTDSRTALIRLGKDERGWHIEDIDVGPADGRQPEARP